MRLVSRRFAAVTALLLASFPAWGGPPVLQGATLFAVPAGANDQYNGAVTETGGINDGRTSILRSDNSNNHGLELVQYDAFGTGPTFLPLADSGIQLNSNMGLALDGAGNWVVAGQAGGGNGSSNSIGAAKYSPTGLLLWSSSVTWFSQSVVQGGRVAVDASGSVYVAANTGGYNCGSRTTVVVKFADGGVVWTRTIDPAVGDNVPAALVADPAGGFYLAYNVGGCGPSNIYVAHFDVNGNFIAGHPTPANGQVGMGLGNGHVYMAFNSAPVTVFEMDPVTMAVGNTGAFSSSPGLVPTSLVVSPGGTVYVGGTMFNGVYDVAAVVTFVPNLSNTVWVQGDDRGYAEANYQHPALGVDAAGDAFFAFAPTNPGGGCNQINDLYAHRFDVDGTRNWFVRYDGPIVGLASGAVADANVAYVAISGPMMLMKYDTTAATPALLWSRSLQSSVYCLNNGGGGGGFGGNGNVGVGGAAIARKVFFGMQIGGSSTLLVERVDASTGVQDLEFGAPSAYALNGIKSVVADSANNVWVIASTQTNTGKLIEVSKFNGNSGALVWSRTTGTPNSQFDGAQGGTVDAAGNAYAVMPADTGGGNIGGNIVKYDSSGNLLWSRTFQAFGGFTYPTSLAVTANGTGTVYLVGITADSLSSPTYWDGVLIGVDPVSGIQTFTRTFNGGKNELTVGVAVDSAGYVLATGELAATISLASSGNGGGPDALGTGDMIIHAFDPTDPCPAPAWSAVWDSGQGNDFGGTPLFPAAGQLVQVVGTTSTFGLRNYTEGSGSVPAPAGLTRGVPGPIDVGTLGRLTLTVTNTGARDLLNVSATLVVTSGTWFVGAVEGPWPTSIGTLIGGTATTFVWTYTPTGAGTLAWTASASGIDECSGTAYATGMIAGSVVAGYRAQLAAALSVSRTSAGIGDVVQVVLSATNSGNPLSSLVVSPTLYVDPAANVQFLSAATSTAFTLAGGASHAFTWSYSVTGSGWTLWSASLSGYDAIFTPPVVGLAAVKAGATLIDQARLSAVVMTSTWNFVSVGQSFPVGFSVSNTGSYAATLVSATIFVGPGSTDVVLASWPGTLTLAAHASTVFVWTYTATASGLITFTMTATGLDTSPLGYALSAAASVSGTAQTVAAPKGQFVQYASTVEVGQSFLITVTDTNTGQSGLSSFQMKVGDMGVSSSLIAGPSMVVTPGSTSVYLAGGGSAYFTATVYGTSPGTMQFAFTITGTDLDSGSFVTSGPLQSNPVTVVPPANLQASFLTLPGTRNTGQSFLVVLTVTNAGGANANGLSASVFVTGAGTASTAQGPTPAFGNLAAGATKTFTWTFTGVSAGGLVFSTTVTATSALSGNVATSGTVVSGGITIQTPAQIASAFNSYAVTRDVGQPFQVTLTLTNTGQATANPGAFPAVWANGGTANISALSPSATGYLTGGTSVTFVWSVTPTSAGSLILSASATGNDGNTNAALALPVQSATISIQTPATLSATLLFSSNIKQGRTFTVILSVTNTGQATATGLTVSGMLTPPGPASLLSGPIPGALATLAGGTTTAFVWTYQGILPNTSATFSATVIGSDVNSGLPVASSQTASLYVNGAAILGSWIAVNPTSLTGGGLSQVVLTVSNGGSAQADNVLPVFTPAAPVTVSKSADPSVGLTLPAGSTTQFYWTLTGNQGGALLFGITTTGNDDLDSTPLYTQASATITVSSSLLSHLDVVPASPKVGDSFQLILTVSQGGSGGANGVVPALTPPDSVLASVSGGPTPSTWAFIAGHTSKTFTWNLTALKEGALTLAASATATVASSPDATSASLTVTIKPAEFVPTFAGEALIFPNPVKGDAAAIAIRLTGDVSKVTVDVYNTGFQRVWHGEWAGMIAGDHRLDVSGIAGWAPGMYLVKMATEGGGKKTYKTIRLAVKR